MPLFPVRRDAASSEFFDAAALGRFLLVHDLTTGEFHGPDFDTSADPGRYLRVPAAGTGRVISWSVVHRRDGGQIVVAIVELDEGPWWWTELETMDIDTDLVGRRVELVVERLGTEEAGESLPFFRARAVAESFLDGATSSTSQTGARE